MRVLVAGGAGYIGSHALLALKEAGHQPVVLDNLSEGHRAAVGDCPLYEGRAGDRPAVRALLERERIGAVMHFAANCYVGESVTDPAKFYQNNVVETLALLDAMREAGVDRFVFSSTCAVYGEPQRLPLTEDHPKNPINPYGQTKAVVEAILRDYHAAYGLRYASLRYFNAAGADPEGRIGEDHDPETHLIPIVLQAALGRRPHVSVFGTDFPTRDGTCVRDYVHVCDLASAHVLALQALDTRPVLTYNLGNGSGFTVREVIETARRITGREIRSVDAARRAGDPPALVGSSELAKRELHWQPRFADLSTIVETAWRWHRDHPNGFGD